MLFLFIKKSQGVEQNKTMPMSCACKHPWPQQTTTLWQSLVNPYPVQPTRLVKNSLVTSSKHNSSPGSCSTWTEPCTSVQPYWLQWDCTLWINAHETAGWIRTGAYSPITAPVHPKAYFSKWFHALETNSNKWSCHLFQTAALRSLRRMVWTIHPVTRGMYLHCSKTHSFRARAWAFTLLFPVSQCKPESVASPWDLLPQVLKPRVDVPLVKENAQGTA